MKNILSIILLASVFYANGQVIWSADPNQSTNVNDFFRRFDGGNYPTDYCYTQGDEAGVASSTATTANDPVYGKVWKVNKPKNRKRGEFARTEGDVNYYAPSEGDDIYIGWRWKVDTEDGASLNNGVAVWQWKSAGAHDQNYPLSMYYDGELTLNAYGPDYDNSTSQSSMRTILWSKAIPQDTWVTFVVRVKVDKDDFGGLVEFWFNGEKQQLGNANSNKYQVNLSADKYTAYHRTNDGDGVYPKWGVYNKNSCAYNANAYFHDMKIASDLASAMPSGSSIENEPPSVDITSPSNGATFMLGETIVLEANASDSDGTIEKVNFKIDGDYYSNDRTEPYSGTFTPTETGVYVISARAFDEENAQTEVAVTIEVVAPNEAPEIEITSPLNGDIFKVGEVITITADATDDVSIQKVNFKIDGGYHSQDLTANGEEYTTTFTPIADGVYTIGTRAFDDEGESTEVSIEIEVQLITALGNGKEKEQFSVYPNPSSGVVHLSESSIWDLYSSSGMKIAEGESKSIDLSKKTKGRYLLKSEGVTIPLIIK